MTTKNVRMSITVEVTVDERKFTPEFMREFRGLFYNFTTLDEHIEHLGQMYARGLYDNHDFIEGYGPADEMGIKFENLRNGYDVEIVP